MRITQHGTERLAKRFKIRKEAQVRELARALELGVRHGDTSGSLNYYLTGEFHKYGTANNIRVFNEKVFILVDMRLITVFVLPFEFRATAKKIQGRIADRAVPLCAEVG